MIEKQKRISFGEYDATRIYEWKLALNQGLDGSCCENCELIEKRIAKFIGNPKRLKRIVETNPYFKNGKRYKKK